MGDSLVYNKGSAAEYMPMLPPSAVVADGRRSSRTSRASGEMRNRRASVIDEFADRRASRMRENLDDRVAQVQTATPKRRCGADNLLLFLTVIAVAVGVVFGLIIRASDNKFHTRKRDIMYLKFPGELFLRMMKGCILPLIVSSLISSLASLQSSTAGRLGALAMGYYFATTFIAVSIGITLSLTIQPGTWTKGLVYVEEGEAKKMCLSSAVDTIMDLLRNLLPDNLVSAGTQTLKTCSTYKKIINNVTVSVDAKVVMDMDAENRSQLLEFPSPTMNNGMNILGLVMFSIIFGFIISQMEEEGRPLMEFFASLEGAMMRLIAIVIWYAPFGITFLIAAQIVETEDPAAELHRLSGYMMTVIVGLLIHGLIVLPAMLFLFTRRNPITYAYGMLQALLTALGTSSSSAALPLSIKCLEENNNIDPRVTRFMLPLGATINMDGTALYEAVAVIYIAHTLGKVLTIGEVVLISLTATLASIGAAGIPQAGIVTMLMVLMAVGLPTRYFVLILPVDWFLDRIRTTINVHGDSIGAGIVAHLCRDYLGSAVATGAEEAVPLKPSTMGETPKSYRTTTTGAGSDMAVHL